MAEEKQRGLFQCRQCGTCCRWEGHVLLTEEDIVRLAVASGLSEERFIERHTILAANRRQLSLAEHPDGRCTFLGESGCAFYEARPEQCREFPLGWHDTSGCLAMEEMDKSRVKR